MPERTFLSKMGWVGLEVRCLISKHLDFARVTHFAMEHDNLRP